MRKPVTMRSTPTRARWAAALLALALCASQTAPAQAAPSCLEGDNQCSPDKLCTFKAQLAEKVFLYQIYLANSQKTKKRGTRDGIRYNGRLYNESMSEAKDAFPNATGAELKTKAGQIFQEKVRKYAAEKFKIPQCKYNGMLNRDLLPKAGYGGMFTDEHCRVRVNYDAGDYDPEGFGATHNTCKEFYDRDQAHEVIHKRSCEAAKAAGKDLHEIDVMIEDEIKSYEHSVRLSLAYVRMLSIRCSTEPNPNDLKARAQRIQDLLTPYLQKGG